MNKLVFDPKLWNQQDVGDNSQFWKEAEILSIEDDTATVKFLHDGRISKDHFIWAMRDEPGMEYGPNPEEDIFYCKWCGTRLHNDHERGIYVDDTGGDGCLENDAEHNVHEVEGD